MDIICTVMYHPGNKDQESIRAAIVRELAAKIARRLATITRVKVGVRCVQFVDVRAVQDIEVHVMPNFPVEIRISEALQRVVHKDFAEFVQLLWQHVDRAGRYLSHIGWSRLLVGVHTFEPTGAWIILKNSQVSSCWGLSGLEPRAYLNGSAE